MDLSVSNSLIIPQPKPSALPQCLSHDTTAKYLFTQSVGGHHPCACASPLPHLFSNAVCSLVQKMQRELADLRPSGRLLQRQASRPQDRLKSCTRYVQPAHLHRCGTKGAFTIVVSGYLCFDSSTA
jgi:hypothetical protein